MDPENLATEEQLAAAADEISEETQTVADDILVEVKECQNKLESQTAALASLQSESATREQLTEALTEIRNTREEMRNLLQEVRTLARDQSNSRLPSNGSPDSTQSTHSQQDPATLPVVSPESAEAASPAATTPKRKRHVI